MSLNNQQLTPIQVTQDLGATFGYTSSDFGFILTNSGAPVHIVWHTGNPVGLLTSVPNGSLCIDATNHHTYTKTGAPGSGNAGAWVVNT